MGYYFHRIKELAIALTAILVFVWPAKVLAEEPVVVLTMPEEIISIELPTVMEPSPFNFIMDPQRLITLTDAAKYGGCPFEEDATIFFENRQDGYGLSSRSDMLAITNKSTVPVKVTVELTLTGFDGIRFAEDKELGDDENDNGIYFAIVDGVGNRAVLDENGTATLTAILAEAPDSAYSYRYYEEIESYLYELNDGIEDSAFDSYLFGVEGACRLDRDGISMIDQPGISLVWHVEPLMPESRDMTSFEKREVLDSVSDSDAVSGSDAGGNATVSGTDAGTDITVSDSDAGGNANVSGADAGTAMTVSGSDAGENATVSGADAGAAMTVSGSDAGENATVSGADARASSTISGPDAFNANNSNSEDKTAYRVLPAGSPLPERG